ncbi:hypothetical protein P7K49_013421 [Saguinus oedipus]|uniref:Uncharacterized protein n=1 Tax=Saguinus oedipus TaxID=9490 RepID=A0ABQ9VG35_SAGOE|nr:hypothetical protein P7K49_013421 [Saguinus oedipus]
MRRLRRQVPLKEQGIPDLGSELDGQFAGQVSPGGEKQKMGRLWQAASTQMISEKRHITGVRYNGRGYWRHRLICWNHKHTKPKETGQVEPTVKFRQPENQKAHLDYNSSRHDSRKLSCKMSCRSLNGEH